MDHQHPVSHKKKAKYNVGHQHPANEGTLVKASNVGRQHPANQDKETKIQNGDYSDQ